MFFSHCNHPILKRYFFPQKLHIPISVILCYPVKNDANEQEEKKKRIAAAFSYVKIHV
jgi:hypothetical protein